MNIHNNPILILDFGSQYSQLIARRVRECGVYCELRAFDMSPKDIKQFNPSGIILSGGPETVTADHTPRAPDIVFELGCPVLGICYGMQTMAQQLGGQVQNAQKHEYGHAQLNIIENSPLFSKVSLDVWMSHGDQVNALPEGFKAIASTDNAPYAAISHEEKQFYGLQFHPEVTHTENGKDILNAFIKDICHCQALWTTQSIIDDAVQTIQNQVGKDHVILGLSGGVDSAVVAALLHKAIGNQLTCIFIDNGLLRLNEREEVLATFAEHMHIKVIAVDAEQKFLNDLKGLTDPEQKRKAAGHAFIDMFSEQAKAMQDTKWLAQGTIYPDVIESAGAKTGKAHVIKTHHNVGGLPEDLHFKLIEPLRELFKDEVRKIGLELGLPKQLIQRHPFPGPGLAVRILGEIKKEYADLLRKADAIFIDELRKHDLYDEVSQAFAVFLPIKSVGVTGDQRRYDYVIALRAVQTVDFMTAKWAPLPYDFLGHVSNRIINEVKGISRVVYDISGKPPATIEWE